MNICNNNIKFEDVFIIPISMAEEQIVDQFSLETTEVGASEETLNGASIKSYRVPIMLVLFGFYFLIFGLVELMTNYSQTFFTVSMECTTNSCSATTDSISFPDQDKVYIYLVNPGFSDKDIQFAVDQQIQSCSSYSTNQAINKEVSITGISLSPSENAYPCGQFISSYPQGSFVIENTETSSTLSINSESLSVFQTQYSNEDTSKQWASVENQRFRVWNEHNLAIGIYKYWGQIQEIISGTFQITIETDNPMTQQFQSGLQVVLTDNEAFTGYNISWCIFNFLVALLQFTLGCISFCVQSKKKGTKNDVDVFNQEDVDQTEVVIKVPRTSF